MKKGAVVFKWTEPRELHAALLRLAKKDLPPKSWTRFLSWTWVVLLFGGLLFWQWRSSDREGLIETSVTIIVLALMYLVLRLFHHFRLKYLPARVWIYEHGIEMGSLLGAREWAAFASIEGFMFDSETLEDRSYRALYWLPQGVQHPEGAILSAEIDEREIRAFLKSKGLDELQPDEE